MPPLSFHEAIAGIMKARRHYPAGSPDGKGGQFMPSDAVGGASESPVWGETEIKASMRRGRDAMRSLITQAAASEPDDAAKMVALQAMSRPEVGDIDFRWGKPGRMHATRNRFVDGYGVSHLIAQRDHDRAKGLDSPPGKAVAMLMPVVIARGTISPPRGPQGAQRVEIKYRGHTAVLSEGGSGHWLLTGWKDWVPGAVQKQSHLPHSYAHRTFVGRSDEGAGTPSNIAPIAKEGKTMQPMNFLDVLKMQAEQPAGSAPLTFSKALAQQQVEKGHFRHADGKFRVGTPVALTDLQDIEVDVPDDDAGLIDAMAKFAAGEVPPPIDIAMDPEGNRVLVRGKKRLAAARKTGQATIPVRITNVAEPFGKADAGALPSATPPRALAPIDDKTSYPPFPYDQTVFARIRPDQVPRFLGVLTDRERWPLQPVKLDQLLAMQNRVETGKVMAKVANSGGGHEPIVVMLEQGRLHIADGHHDLAAAWLRGEAEKSVRFADLTPVTNVLKADMPVAPGTLVRVKPEHRNDNWFLERVGDAVGEVIASWIVAEGDNAGKTALAVEWLTPGICGMYRGLDAVKVEVVIEPSVPSDPHPPEVPEAVIALIEGAEGATIFASTFRAALKNGTDESSAYATAWEALSKAGYAQFGPDAKWRRISKAAAALPAVGDLIDFDDDHFSDKGPASGTVAAVIRNSVVIDFGDGTPEDLEVIDWRFVASKAKAERREKPNGKVAWSVHGKPDEPPADDVAKCTATSPDRFTLSANICKVDDDQRLVFGWFSIVEIDGKPVTDREGDRISPTELETAAYGHVLNARVASDTHALIGVGDLIESCVFTAEKQKAMLTSLIAMDIPAMLDLCCVGWWGGYHITDDKVWAEIKAGNYVSFSIGGTGTRTPTSN